MLMIWCLPMGRATRLESFKAPTRSATSIASSTRLTQRSLSCRSSVSSVWRRSSSGRRGTTKRLPMVLGRLTRKRPRGLPLRFDIELCASSSSFRSGDTVILPPNEVHQLINTGSAPLRLLAAFNMSPVRVELPDGIPIDLPCQSAGV
jgi:hypothetical protein